MPKYVISPITREGLTKGNRYRVVSDEGTAFRIVDNDGDEIYCLYERCPHLAWRNWIIEDEGSKPFTTRQMLTIKLSWNTTLVLELTDVNLKLARQIIELPVYDDNYVGDDRVWFPKEQREASSATIGMVNVSEQTYSEYREANPEPVAEAAE